MEVALVCTEVMLDRKGRIALKELTVQFASFIGVDLHKKTVSLSAVGPDRLEIDFLKTSTKCVGRIEKWLADLPKPCWMAVETVGFVEWFIDRFRSHVDRIDIADATQLAYKRGRRRRSDRNDARDIAERLSRGECPLGFIADDALMQLRKLGRHWRSLSRTLSRAKHCVKSMLHAANIRGPQLNAASAHRWYLVHSHLLKPAQHDAFEDFLEIIALLERKRERLRRRIFFANRSERFADTVDLIKTVPGIDEIWGCVIAAEVGPFDRFPNADTLEFWAGLTPDNQKSAGRTQSGKITKAGSATLRWALCQAAMTLCQSDPKQEATRQRLIKRLGKTAGKAKANVAMGRRLLRIIFAMMRDRKPYLRIASSDRPAAANRARLKARSRKEPA